MIRWSASSYSKRKGGGLVKAIVAFSQHVGAKQQFYASGLNNFAQCIIALGWFNLSFVNLGKFYCLPLPDKHCWFWGFLLCGVTTHVLSVHNLALTAGWQDDVLWFYPIGHFFKFENYYVYLPLCTLGTNISRTWWGFNNWEMEEAIVKPLRHEKLH